MIKISSSVRGREGMSWIKQAVILWVGQSGLRFRKLKSCSLTRFPAPALSLASSNDAPQRTVIGMFPFARWGEFCNDGFQTEIHRSQPCKMLVGQRWNVPAIFRLVCWGTVRDSLCYLSQLPNLPTPGCGEGKCSVYCKAADKASRAVSAQNTPELLDGFQESIFFFFF